MGKDKPHIDKSPLWEVPDDVGVITKETLTNIYNIMEKHELLEPYYVYMPLWAIEYTKMIKQELERQ